MQADIPVPKQHPHAAVDDHDGQHDADKDGDKGCSPGQECRLRRVCPDFREERNQEGRKEEKMCRLKVILQTL